MFNVSFVRVQIVVMLAWPLLWDWFVVLSGRADLTITDVFRRWSREQPLLPFVLGAVTVHLVWFTLSEMLNGGPAPPRGP
jgi:hypothetical protein